MAAEQLGQAPLGPVTCPRPGCGKAISRPHDIPRHIRDVHEVEKWRCPFPSCRYKGANRRDKVVAHIRNNHQNTGVFDGLEIIRPQPITQKQRDLQLAATKESTHTEYPNDQDPYRTYATASSLDDSHFSNMLPALSSVEPPDSNLPTTHSVRDEHTSLSSLPSPNSTVPVPTYGQTHSMLRPDYPAAELSPRNIPTSLPPGFWNTGGLSSFSGAGEAPESAMTQDSLNQEPQYNWSHFEQLDDAYYPYEDGSGV